MISLQHEHLLVTHCALCGCMSQVSLKLVVNVWGHLKITEKKTLFILYCGSEKKILTKLSWFELLPSLASSKLSWQMLKTIFESKEVLWYNIIKSVFVTSGIMNVFSSAFSLCADNTYRETYSFLLPRNLNFRPSQKPNRTIVLFSKWFEPKQVEYDRPFKRCLE